MAKSAASAPLSVYSSARSSGCVAATGSPRASPAEVFSATSRVARNPSRKAGATGAGPKPPNPPPPVEVVVGVGVGRGRGRWWWRWRWWRRRRNQPNCERILCQSRNRVGLVADLDCSFTFLAYREMERLVDCAPPVQSVVEFVFANLLYGLWRRRVSARGKSAVHLAEAEYSYVVVKVLVDVGTDAKLVPFPMDGHVNRGGVWV